VAAIFALMAVVSSLVYGWLNDRYGGRLLLGVAVSLVGAIAFGALGCFSMLTPIVGAVVLGLVLGATPPIVFPSIVVVVPPQILGTTFGACKTLEFFGYVIFSLAFGGLTDLTGSFDVGCALFIALCLFTAATFALLKLYFFEPAIAVVVDHSDHSDYSDQAPRFLDIAVSSDDEPTGLCVPSQI
jgi:MFS family permease